MARVTDVFVEGSVENIIFYRRMGKSCARIKRSHINQTEATKMRGTNFGVDTHRIEIPYNNIEIPAQTLQFHVPIPAQSLTVTAARLIYNEIKNNQLYPIENTRFMPAEIINARYEK
jgi:hypothetical protein